MIATLVKNVVTAVVFLLLLLLWLPAAQAAAIALGFFIGGLIWDLLLAPRVLP